MEDNHETALPIVENEKKEELEQTLEDIKFVSQRKDQAQFEVGIQNKNVRNFNKMLKQIDLQNNLNDIDREIQDALDKFPEYELCVLESEEAQENRLKFFECEIKDFESIHPRIVDTYLKDISNTTYASLKYPFEIEYVKYKRAADGIFIVTRIVKNTEKDTVINEEPLFFIDVKNSMFGESTPLKDDPFARMQNRFVEEQKEIDPSITVVKDENGKMSITPTVKDDIVISQDVLNQLKTQKVFSSPVRAKDDTFTESRLPEEKCAESPSRIDGKDEIVFEIQDRFSHLFKSAKLVLH